ncbi:hypothetical protein GLS40_08050 [Pseudooceanicola sp. 216_PA32_1]|uniref:Type I restriction modification DNA specificity domain-containing protein n=1 Tax=Pseudooceanicola pacificus TaxID=2676438 RepID=A0A844W581_9RHOB|nr:restriction endonuclease subunit S [Pseudooceanicola pacificus]MWB77971.1 hypothetical protein [Pseudooceanicola pacificus]
MTGLPQGWAQTTLSEASKDISYGFTTSATSQQGRPKFLRITDVQDYSVNWASVPYCQDEPPEKFNLASGDIVIARTGATTGKSYLISQVPERTVFASYLIRVRANVCIDPPFLSRFMQSPAYWEQITTVSKGTAQPGANASILGALEIPLPPLPEQRRIVRKLDTLSARSSTARTQLTALEKLVPRYKLAVLRSAFAGELTAKFRAERALEAVSTLLKRVPPLQQGRGGRQPTTEVIAGRGGISVNVPDVDLPEGWDWVPLLRVARQETGHTPSRSRPDWWDGDVCWMSIPDANVHHGRVIYDTLQKTNEEGLANSSARLLPAGTVVLSRTASVGYICILGKDMATSQDFATWTCTDALLPEYLMYALLSEGEDIKKFGEGSTHTTIYFPEIRAFHIKLAPIEEQHEIVRRIKAAFAKIDRLAAEATKALKLLGHLDQRILAKAFAGDLVPQDPNDEPAETLLARIVEARATAPKAKRGRKAKA